MKIKLDLKEVLMRVANWRHPDFGVVAKFIAGLGKDGVIEVEVRDKKQERKRVLFTSGIGKKNLKK